MHAALGIFRAAKEYLLSIAEELGYQYIKEDFALDNWSQHDSFLMTVAEAGVVWLYNMLPANGKDMSFEEILKKISPNKHVSFFNIYLLCIFDFNIHFHLFV